MKNLRKKNKMVRFPSSHCKNENYAGNLVSAKFLGFIVPPFYSCIIIGYILQPHRWKRPEKGGGEGTGGENITCRPHQGLSTVYNTVSMKKNYFFFFCLFY